ncbi:TadE/TadG family type IV pilus assembly protein [Salinactinospora qingdaonensis]|uniref:TadE-like domain-containing protein n=1 Tax=Salinactinospora qingdaonensis TaxID=702744 RepID=A0ABP7FNR0_9ACTN
MAHPPRSGDDRGSTEVAIATPLMLLLIMLVVQVAVWAHAGHAAETIARHTLAATRTAEATQAGGSAAAEQATAQLAGDLLTDIDVTVRRGATTAEVTVEAHVPTLLPGMTWPVRQQLSAPVERYVPATVP